MTSLQPIQAMSLDSIQQKAFVKYYSSLTEKPPTTVRIFDRNDYYSVHGEDATTASKEVFSSVGNIKRMGVEPNKLDYLVLSKGNFETLVKKLLLVRRYRIEIYVPEGPPKNCEWELKYKASPGCLTQLEEVLGEGLGAAAEAGACLMAVNIKSDPITKGRLIGVACVSGLEYQMSVSEFTDDDLLTGLEAVTVQMAPSECLVPAADTDEYKAVKKIMQRSNVTVTKLKKPDFATDGLIQDLNRLLKFKENQLEDANAFPETTKTVAMPGLAAAIKYLSLLEDSTNFGRYRIGTLHSQGFLHIDSAALAALHVFPEEAGARSLYGYLDACRTQHGKRLLAQWLRQPLRDIHLINERLDVVEVLASDARLRLQLADEHLRRVPDLQALARRLGRRRAGLQDCYRIYQAVARLPALLRCLSAADHPTVLAALTEPLAELADDLQKYVEMIESTVDTAAVERGDYLVKASFDEQLQSLADQMDKIQRAADKELSKAARDLGLDAGKTIKLESMPQLGFCFRVTMKEEQTLRGNKKYTIIDAVKGGVRFKTTALESLMEDYVQAKADYEREQDKVVAEIVAIAAGYSECISCVSQAIARVDALVAMATATTRTKQSCRPILTATVDRLYLEGASHPCVEMQDGVDYIPNDVELNRSNSLMHVVTGANMGGKSTWMRSAGVAVLLAHVGCFVPCRSAEIPLLRSIRARVGASDREQAGQSTFMLEMVETAAILRAATEDSLVLIDELGRGTSTYEGCGLAWAIAEELATKIRCFSLFATHYHELTRLAALHEVIVNSHAEATVVDDQLVLTHRILPGPATNSLGLRVAALADLPDSIIKYAEEKQAELETNVFGLEAIESAESKEGEKMIKEFLRKCKEIEKATSSDEEMERQIEELKKDILQNDNKYIQALIAA